MTVGSKNQNGRHVINLKIGGNRIIIYHVYYMGMRYIKIKVKVIGLKGLAESKDRPSTMYALGK